MLHARGLKVEPWHTVRTTSRLQWRRTQSSRSHRPSTTPDGLPGIAGQEPLRRDWDIGDSARATPRTGIPCPATATSAGLHRWRLFRGPRGFPRLHISEESPTTCRRRFLKSYLPGAEKSLEMDESWSAGTLRAVQAITFRRPPYRAAKMGDRKRTIAPARPAQA